MVEETLSSSAPKVSDQSKPSNDAQAPADRQTAVRKSASTRTAAKPVARQQRLITHLLIGFLMAGIAIAGYAFLGPDASASAADTASQRLIDVNTNGAATDFQTNAGVSIPQSSPAQTSAKPAMTSDITTSDMAALQAEMAEITRQMIALNAGNLPVNRLSSGGAVPDLVGNGGSTSTNGAAVNNPDQIQSTLEQMMANTHEMMAKMESIDNQVGGAGSPSSGAGHH